MTGPIGPFWRQKPMAATTTIEWGWAYIWLGRYGDVCAIEWLS